MINAENRYVRNTEVCRHGVAAGLHCFDCRVDAAPKCNKHGHPFYCGHCGPVSEAR